MIKVAEAHHDVELACREFRDRGQRISTCEVVLPVRDALALHVPHAVLDEIWPYFDARRVFRTCLQRRETPSPVVTCDVEQPASPNDVAIKLDDRTIALVQPVFVGACLAGLKESRIGVKKTSGIS